MQRKLPGKQFRKFGFTSQGFGNFGDFWNFCFIRSWKLPKLQYRTFWLNGRRPLFHLLGFLSDRGRLGYTSPVFLCFYKPRWRRVKLKFLAMNIILNGNRRQKQILKRSDKETKSFDQNFQRSLGFSCYQFNVLLLTCAAKSNRDHSRPHRKESTYTEKQHVLQW